MEEVMEVRKRARDEADEAESDIDSPEVKRLREDLLDGLDDDTEICTSSQDLDSFMKSFEEEIIASTSAATGARVTRVVDPATESGDCQPDLGYLLEASDDELGIPPPTASPVLVENELKAESPRIESDSSDFWGDLWDFPRFDSVGFGLAEVDTRCNEYVALEGLFDYSDLGLGSGDIAWKPETLPAQ